MSVIEVNKMWSVKQSSLSTSDRRRYRVTLKEGYQVVHDPDTLAGDILLHPDIPRAGQSFPGAPFLYAGNVAPNQISPIFSMVSVDWSGEIGPNGFNDSPANIGPSINWSDVETEEETDEDFDGNPIVTVNNEPIYGVTTKVVDDVVTIQRNFLFFSPYVRRAYRRAVNSDTFLGWPPGTAKIMQLDGQAVNNPQGGIDYWQATLKVQFREPYNTTPDKAWYARVRHEGYYEKVSTKIVRAVDDNKEPVTTPVLLKADGTRETDPANAHWLEFKRYGTLPFNALGFI